VRPDLDLPEQLLVRAAEDADARSAPVARAEQVVLLVDKDAGDPGRSASERRYVCAAQSSTSIRSAPVWATYIRRPAR
jgi:hypothetical protein